MHGKLEIALGKEKYQLWFNNYSAMEYRKQIEKRYEGANLIDGVQKLSQENEFALLAEMIWAGICGFKFAKDIPLPIERQEVFELVGDADIKELGKVSNAFFRALGKDLETVKKKAVKRKKK